MTAGGSTSPGGTAGRSVVVVGGGLSGLAAAYRLQEAGAGVTVLERNPEVGGPAGSERHGRYLLDIGPDLINETFVRTLGLARELGLGEDIVASSRSVDLLREGRPRSVHPRRPWSMARTPALSWRGKAAVAGGYARLRPTLRTLDPYSMTSHAATDHGTARELCDRYFDREVTDWLIDPVLRAFAGSGVDHASGLSVLGALAVGMKDTYALRGGIATLPRALARRLDARCDVEVTGLAEEADGVTVCYRDRDGSHELRADACVLAVSFHDAVGMWPALADAAGDFGAALRDVPLMSISLGYDAPSTESYAVLVPTAESRHALLAMMQQNKAPDRAPAGATLATVFTDAAATPRMLARSDDEIVDWTADFLETYYPGLRGRRELGVVHRWPRTGYLPVPGYWAGISETRSRLPRGAVHPTSTLFGSGGMERAVLGGERAARRTVEWLAA